MPPNIKAIGIELLRGFWPLIVAPIWMSWFWNPISHSLSLLNKAEIVIVIFVFCFSAVIDTAITQQSGRVSVAIVFSYASWLLITLVLLTIVSDQLAGSGLLGLYAIASFLLLRGSAQLYESDILRRSR